MKNSVIGILAHVDAGKTTLAEAMLYTAGNVRKPGRVDNGNTVLDNHSLEKERGITIFSSQAVINYKNSHFTLLDTPGHVDFSAETERTLSVLDYAVLVISGIDGVQAHTVTLWKLLEHYRIPVFIFVTKMDFARQERSQLIAQLQKELDEGCIDFSSDATDLRNESIAMCKEDILEKFLENGTVSKEDTACAIKSRLIFPCLFGSGLKIDGVEYLLDTLDEYVSENIYPDEFGARVFKITHENNTRLVHMKVTGGKIKVRDSIKTENKEEKIAQIRIYSGLKYTAADEAKAGEICAVTGLEGAENSCGLGFEKSDVKAVLEPVMNYRILLPDGCDPQMMLPKLRLLEEEDPQLKITWNTHLQEIHAGLMGEVQTEILKSLIRERFDTDVEFDKGRVLYKETITNRVEGVGHYEPLRHYAEVHLIMEPLPRGSGLKFDSVCSEDSLERNWQRLVLMHLSEKQHLGVMTGSPVTDMKITLAAGRAHIKHTEGGDFRQATYRAVRHGLMNAQSILLEPFCTFRLEIPPEQLGRAISDIRMKSGTFDSPEEYGDMAVLKGKAPFTEINGYASEVAAYTGGRGRLFCEISGYEECHNAQKVIEEFDYLPESDVENTPDSVFCAHGGGFNVKWNKVSEYMHLEPCIKKEKPYTAQVNHRNLHIDDKELEAIMNREFGKVKYELYRTKKEVYEQEERVIDFEERKQYVIVDGYNVIFAWDDLKSMAEVSLESARERLMQILCNYAAFTKYNVVLVFDAYKVPGNQTKRFDFHNIHVVFTKERELGDVYIEKLISEIGKNERVRVVTSDGLIQLSAVRAGVLRMSAREFEQEVDSVHKKIGAVLKKMEDESPQIIFGDIIK